MHAFVAGVQLFAVKNKSCQSHSAVLDTRARGAEVQTSDTHTQPLLPSGEDCPWAETRARGMAREASSGGESSGGQWLKSGSSSRK